MNYENFVKYMNRIVQIIELQDQLDSDLRNYNNKSKDYPASIYMPSLVSEVIQLLEIIMDDETTGWISYWVYELDCGRRYTPATVTQNDQIVPLKTIEDLWKVLSEK